jgi:hypothetical protein
MNTAKVVNRLHRTLNPHLMFVKRSLDEESLGKVEMAPRLPLRRNTTRMPAVMNLATLCGDEDSFHQANEIAPPLPLRRNTTLYGARPVPKLTPQELEAFIDVYVKADYLSDGLLATCRMVMMK